MVPALPQVRAGLLGCAWTWVDRLGWGRCVSGCRGWARARSVWPGLWCKRWEGTGAWWQICARSWGHGAPEKPELQCRVQSLPWSSGRALVSSGRVAAGAFPDWCWGRRRSAAGQPHCLLDTCVSPCRAASNVRLRLSLFSTSARHPGSSAASVVRFPCVGKPGGHGLGKYVS